MITDTDKERIRASQTIKLSSEATYFQFVFIPVFMGIMLAGMIGLFFYMDGFDWEFRMFYAIAFGSVQTIYGVSFLRKLRVAFLEGSILHLDGIFTSYQIPVTAIESVVLSGNAKYLEITYQHEGEKTRVKVLKSNSDVGFDAQEVLLYAMQYYGNMHLPVTK